MLSPILVVLLGFIELRPETAGAFDRYVGQAEARMQDHQPLRGREMTVEAVPGVKLGGLQDWQGSIFIPAAGIAEVKAVLQDYENYKNYYQPEVIESKQTGHAGDAYDVFLRLYEKHMLTIVLNANYHVRYNMPDAQHLLVTSHSTRIAEVKNPKKSYTDELPVGNDTGFLWRLNSYWRFEAADGGVYAQCRAISLSRDVPLGLGFLLKGFLEQFPRESMLNTLRGTKGAVMDRSGLTPASSGK